ncbi:MAG TPA: class I SAM-dependent methyltransferase [Streptosporangiaceae bacterium]|nr:class I SAM-dependent methyltransferase [Streptosporangiaceae bacterium]
MAADFRRDGVRFSLVWDVLQDVVSARAAEAGRAALDIVDVGGGTGGLAVPFAALGHNVTVIDPSPDALAAAQRRAAEAGARLTAVQGEAASLDSVTGPKSADLVICHNVLEYVDSPADAMTAIAAVLRPSATVSVLAANTVAAVLHRALAGRFTEARQLLGGEAAEAPAAAGAVAGPPRRFTLPELTALIEAAGLRAGESHGLRIFGGLVPGALLDADPGGTEALRALEAAAAAAPPLRDIAAQLHLLGHR